MSLTTMEKVANQDNPFNQPGVENSEFFNKILKTHHEEGNPPNNETEAEEVKNDVLDVEDDSIFQEEIAYENEESEELLAIADSVKLWKATAEYQPLVHKQDLLYYNIIDTSLDDIPQLTNNRLEFIKSLKIAAYQTPTQLQPLDLNYANCYTFSDLQSFYNNNKSRLSYSVKNN
jgi:hypothetical protein